MEGLDPRHIEKTHDGRGGPSWVVSLSQREEAERGSEGYLTIKPAERLGASQRKQTSRSADLRMSKLSQNGQDPRSKKTKHYRPKLAREGNLWTPRWVARLVREGKITWREAGALISVLDETKGWPVLNRCWVRLTRSDWGEMMGVSARQACKVRDQLLEKGLLRQRPASEAPEAIEPQERTGYHYAVLEPGALEWMPEIESACDPEK